MLSYSMIKCLKQIGVVSLTIYVNEDSKASAWDNYLV